MICTRISELLTRHNIKKAKQSVCQQVICWRGAERNHCLGDFFLVVLWGFFRGDGLLELSVYLKSSPPYPLFHGTQATGCSNGITELL